MTQTKKLFASVAVLLLALAMAVTTTYAWFSMSTSPTINGFDVNVTSEEGLLIAVTAFDSTKDYEEQARPAIDDYRATLSSTTIADAIGANRALKALTSTDGIDLKMLNGASVVSGDSKNTAAYVDFNLFFFSETSALTVKLNLESDTATAVTSTPLAGRDNIAIWWKDDSVAEGEYTATGGDKHAAFDKGDPIEAKAKNAVRISFIDATADTTTAQVYEPNHLDGFSDENIALEYYNHMNETSLTVPVGANAPVSTFKASTNIVTLVETDPETIVTDPAGYVGHVVVRIWIEGWDGDALDAILQDKLTITLQFVKA